MIVWPTEECAFLADSVAKSRPNYRNRPRLYPPVFAGMFATLRPVCVEVASPTSFTSTSLKTIHVHHSRANVLATDVAVRGRATSGLTGTA